MLVNFILFSNGTADDNDRLYGITLMCKNDVVVQDGDCCHESKVVSLPNVRC